MSAYASTITASAALPRDHGVCGQCRHYRKLVEGQSGDCHGLPPDTTAAGFSLQRVVGHHRPSCVFFDRVPIPAEMTPAEVKAAAPDAVKWALERDKAHLYDGPPAPKNPPKGKGGEGETRGRKGK